MFLFCKTWLTKTNLMGGGEFLNFDMDPTLVCKTIDHHSTHHIVWGKMQHNTSNVHSWILYDSSGYSRKLLGHLLYLGLKLVGNQLQTQLGLKRIIYSLDCLCFTKDIFLWPMSWKLLLKETIYQEKCIT